MRNDLERLVFIPGSIQRVALLPLDADGKRILTNLIRREEHDGWDEDAHEPVDFDALERSRANGLY